MRPIDAIELTLRTESAALGTDRLLHAIHGLILEQPFTQNDLQLVAKANADRLQVSPVGMIQLTPERLADRVGFFQEQLVELRNGLRTIPLAGTQWLELALVYALALRPKGSVPAITVKGKGLWVILDELAKEYPEVAKQLGYVLDNGGMAVTGRLQGALLCMAAAALTPLEHVQMMRSVLSRDAHMGQFCTPWSVAELMARLLGDGVKEVFDPAADASVLPVVLALSRPASAEGVFMNRFAQFFTTLQARVLGVSLSSVLNDQYESGTTKTFMHCISAPPFGGRIMEINGLRGIPPYEVAINQIIKRLAPKGKAVILVPESFLFSNTAAATRKRLVGEGLLRAVFSLPNGMFRPYAAVKTSILLIERVETGFDTILFADTSNYVSRGSDKQSALDVARFMKHLDRGSAKLKWTSLSAERILQDKYATLVNDRYALAAADAVETEDGVELVELGTLLLQHEREVAGMDVPYVQVSDLASDSMDLVRTAEHGRADRPVSAKGAKLVSERELLLARVGGMLKPTLFDPSKGPIAIGSNVFAFSIDTSRVDPHYLALELRSGAVQEQVSNYVKGSGVPSLSKADMMRILVRLPDTAEQKRFVAEQFDLGLFMEQLKRTEEPLGSDELDHLAKLLIKNMTALGPTGLKKVLVDWRQHDLKMAERVTLETAQENMKMLRHQFNNRLGWVTTGLGNVSRFIDGLVEDQVIPMDMPIAPSLEGEEAPSPSISKSMTQILRNADQLPELFDRLVGSMERSDMRMEFIEIDEFLRTNIIPMYENDSRFKLVMEPPVSGSTSAYVDPFALKQVITNIMDNAIQHGFTDSEKHYNLYIFCGDMTIAIANDGTPPTIELEEMKLRGRSVGPKAGSGEGLYWADLLIRQMDGRLYTVEDDSRVLEVPVTFSVFIELPALS